MKRPEQVPASGNWNKRDGTGNKNSLVTEAPGMKIQLRFVQMKFHSLNQGAVVKRRDWNKMENKSGVVSG